jgi:hypothetical protein
MVSMLVDYAVEHVAIDATARLLPDLDAAGLRRVAERLDTLPPAATLERAFDTEQRHFGGWAIRWLKDLERAGAKDMLAKVQALVGPSPDSEEILKLVDDASAARLVQALEALDPFFDEQRRLVVLPRDRFLAQWPAAQKKQSANPVARVMLPVTTKIVDARDRYRARFAMLKAAVAVVRDGQAALAKHPDPFGSGPFEYKALPQGFELRSKLTLEGKAVTLTVGPPEK